MKSTALIERRILHQFDPIACAKAPRPLETACIEGLKHAIQEAIHMLDNGFDAAQTRRWLTVRLRQFTAAPSPAIAPVGKEGDQ